MAKLNKIPVKGITYFNILKTVRSVKRAMFSFVMKIIKWGKPLEHTKIKQPDRKVRKLFCVAKGKQ